MTKCPTCACKSHKISKKNKFTYYKCSNCQLIFVNPKQIESNYQKQYEKDISSPLKYYQKTRNYDKKSFIGRLNIINKFIKNRGSLLEIGCSTGTFLKLAQDSGWHITGIEPNKNIFNKYKNNEIINSYFNLKFAKSHNKKYDLVYSSDVIEHIPNPTEFIKACKKILNKKAHLVIITPDFNNILSKLFQMKPTEHLVCFNKNSLNFLLKKNGFKIIHQQNIHRFRNINCMQASTTFTDQNNLSSLIILVKLINFLNLNKIIEFFLNFFKEDLFIIARKSS